MRKLLGWWTCSSLDGDDTCQDLLNCQDMCGSLHVRFISMQKITNNEVKERTAYGIGHAVVTILENTTHLIPHVSDLLDHVR